MMDHKRKLFYFTLFGILFTAIVGSLSHFIYNWSGNMQIIGFFTPVNESTWEHMKLLFFPMLIYSFFMGMRLRTAYPCILSALALGILAGSLMIPVLFYTYTGILGFHLLFLDIAVFLASILIAFITVYRLAVNCSVLKFDILLKLGVILLLLAFFFFTYAPPTLALFQSP